MKTLFLSFVEVKIFPYFLPHTERVVWITCVVHFKPNCPGRNCTYHHLLILFHDVCPRRKMKYVFDHLLFLGAALPSAFKGERQSRIPPRWDVLRFWNNAVELHAVACFIGEQRHLAFSNPICFCNVEKCTWVKMF